MKNKRGNNSKSLSPKSSKSELKVLTLRTRNRKSKRKS